MKLHRRMFASTLSKHTITRTRLVADLKRSLVDQISRIYEIANHTLNLYLHSLIDTLHYPLSYQLFVFPINKGR